MLLIFAMATLALTAAMGVDDFYRERESDQARYYTAEARGDV